MVLNGWPQWALIDTGCGCTLVPLAHDVFVSKVLKMKCVNGDRKEYCTKQVSSEIGGVRFTC